MQKQLEDASLLHGVSQLHLRLRLIERIADLPSIEDQVVKRVCEGDHSIVLDLVVLMDADHMLGTSLLEDFTNELRVACCNDDKLQGIFVAAFFDHLFECLGANECTSSIFGLEQE